MPPAPAAPPPAVIVPAPPSKPLPPPTTTINVSSLPKPDAPSKPPVPGSARARMREELSRAAGIEPPKPSPAPAAKPDSPPEQARTELGEEIQGREADTGVPQAPKSPPPAAPDTTTPGAASSAPTTPAEQRKLSPWKLVDQFKEKALKAEARALELEKQVIPEPERKATTEKLAKYEQRIKELEEVVRFTDYRKSEEFQVKYQKPYESAVQRAMQELGELTIGQGENARPVNANDLFELVALPLPKAKELASQVFGDFASDVMFHRKEIKALFEAQNQALQEAQKNGAQREEEARQKMAQSREALTSEIKSTWNKIHADLLADEKVGVYFKPREGDQDWNERLTKGFELVDGAFEQNAADPKLTPEQRAAVIRRHAAVRNRAAGWGPLRFENGKLKAEIEALKQELGQFKASTPATGGQQPGTASATPPRAKDAMFAALQKLAH